MIAFRFHRLAVVVVAAVVDIVVARLGHCAQTLFLSNLPKREKLS
jgi:hypothetical protein